MAKIKQKGKRFYILGTFDGKQREIALATDSKSTATSRFNRFELTRANDGFQAALEELQGKKILKRGEDPTYEQMAKLYRDYVSQSDTAPREITIAAHLRNLKRCIEATPEKTVSRIKPDKVRKELLPENPTPSQFRSYASIIRSVKGIFKRDALAYYHSRGIKVNNPFDGIKLKSPQVVAYSPLPSETRLKIWNDAQKELSADHAMIVLLALGGGLRRAEIQACRDHWFSVQADLVYLSIQEEKGFIPKSGEKRVVPITSEMWGILKKLRGDKERKFFIGRDGETLGTDFRAVSKWLRDKGVKSKKPLHSMRAEAGSLIAKQGGILEASRFLGHSTIVVTAKHYAGIEKLSPVLITDNPAIDPLAALAAQYGVSVDDLKKNLGKLAKKAAKPS